MSVKSETADCHVRQKVSLDDTGLSNPTWDDPSFVLSATPVMIDNSGADMTPFGGVDYEAATPITKVANEYGRQFEPQVVG